MYLLVDAAIYAEPRFPKELIVVAESIEALEGRLFGEALSGVVPG